MSRNSSEQQKRNVATFGALAGLLFAGSGLAAIAVMVLPAAIQYVLLTIAVFAAIGTFQYYLWGWKLDRYRISDDDEDNQNQNS